MSLYLFKKIIYIHHLNLLQFIKINESLESKIFLRKFREMKEYLHGLKQLFLLNNILKYIVQN